MNGAVAWAWTHQAASAPPIAWAPTDMRGQLRTRPQSQWQQPGVYPYFYRDVSAVAGVTVHYTAGPPTQTVQDVANYQTGPGAQEDFPAIAYHLFVDGQGVAYLCHDFNVRVWGSGQPGANETQIHCCYAGDVEPNAAQLAAIKAAIGWADAELKRALVVKGHKDGYATECPGPKWPAWRDAILP